MANIALFSLSNSPRLASKVADILRIKLGEVEIRRFADGESLVKIISDIKDKDVYVIESISRPVNDSLMELLIFINAAKNNGAKSISVITPYMGYSRQDRVAKEGEPISAELVANMISASGAKSFYTFDVHTLKTLEYFSISAENLSTCDLFAKKYVENLGLDYKDIVVVSPDHGSINRGKDLSKYLPGSDVAIISKYRPAPNVAKSIKLDGNVKDKHAIIVDDIIDTALTISGAIKLLRENGAKSIRICASHPVFSKDAYERIKDVDGIAVTDSVYQNFKGIEIISLADSIANIIKENK